MYTAVPAFWTAPTQMTCQGGDCWTLLSQGLSGGFPHAGKQNVVVVGDETWPSSNTGAEKTVIDALQRGPGCTVLGYVTTRNGTPNLLASSQIQQKAQAWFNAFPEIDGVYFDEAVLPNDVTGAQTAVTDFRTTYGSTRKLMVLAGQCPDPWVVAGPSGQAQNAPDWALLWEDTIMAYRKYFYPALPNGNGTAIPDWWKDPTWRPKIAHNVHHCTSPQDWQDAVGLAVERNVGLVFAFDVPGGPAQDLYDHLPPFWTTETGWTNSYNDHSVGLADHELMRAARLWGVSQGHVHAWPNFEQAWYSPGPHQVRGTFSLHSSAGIGTQTVTAAALGSTPAPFNVPTVWSAVHSWATAHGYLTAMPTFEVTPAGEYAVVTFAASTPWLTLGTVPVADTYQQPSFAEAGAVGRNVNRVAAAQGHMTAFPTFVADPADPTGRTFQGAQQYQCVFVAPSAPVTWQDVPGTTYGQQIPVPPLPFHPRPVPPHRLPNLPKGGGGAP